MSLLLLMAYRVLSEVRDVREKWTVVVPVASITCTHSFLFHLQGPCIIPPFLSPSSFLDPHLAAGKSHL